MPVCRQVLSAEAPSYISRHKQLVTMVLHAAGTLGLNDQVLALTKLLFAARTSPFIVEGIQR